MTLLEQTGKHHAFYATAPRWLLACLFVVAVGCWDGPILDDESIPCNQDGICDWARCDDDYDFDCPCKCDRSIYCDARQVDVDEICECDSNCYEYSWSSYELVGEACSDDGHCDPFCTLTDGASTDPNCPFCPCSLHRGICEVGIPCSQDVCVCDPDCDGEELVPCQADGFCDPNCPQGVDPDCSGSTEDGATCASVCASDGLCNTTEPCGGLVSSEDTTDPDCKDCACNIYPGLCDAVGVDEDVDELTYSAARYEPCPCDWDCQGGRESCEDDGTCDIKCCTPNGSDGWIEDYDCSDEVFTCTCSYKGGVCEVAEKCSTTPCWCDLDCSLPMAGPCIADGHCDSWCPTDKDPDCEDDPGLNGKFCD